MKNLFFQTSLLLLIFWSAGSCKGDDPAVTPELTVSKNEFELSEMSDATFFHVKSNVAWTVTSSEAWCTVTPTTGKAGTIKIDVSVTENESVPERTAVITVTAGELAKQINVSQDGATLLTVSENEFEVEAAGEQIIVGIQSSGSYQQTIEGDWISFLPGGGVGNLMFSVRRNNALFGRSGTITFTLENLTQVVTITQTGQPLTIASDNTGHETDAIALAPLMGAGWNLGNTLEATSVNNGVYTASETLWGNPLTTKTLIDGVKAAGFNTVRIPCAWSGYIEDETTYRIKDSWLARVKEEIGRAHV